MEPDEDRYRRFNLRIPRELYSELTRVAAERSHSVNAEIVARLEDSFSESPTNGTPLVLTVYAHHVDIEERKAMKKAMADLVAGATDKGLNALREIGELEFEPPEEQPPKRKQARPPKRPGS
jgi:hypothetical protein